MTTRRDMLKMAVAIPFFAIPIIKAPCKRRRVLGVDIGPGGCDYIFRYGNKCSSGYCSLNMLQLVMFNYQVELCVIDMYPETSEIRRLATENKKIIPCVYSRKVGNQFTFLLRNPELYPSQTILINRESVFRGNHPWAYCNVAESILTGKWVDYPIPVAYQGFRPQRSAISLERNSS